MPGDLQQAVAEYRAALRIDPDFAQAHLNLGIAYAQMPGQLADAITEYQTALRLKPDLAEAHSDLANALSADTRPGSGGIAEYREALRIKARTQRQLHFESGEYFARRWAGCRTRCGVSGFAENPIR